MPTLQVINVHRTLCGRTDTNSFKRFMCSDFKMNVQCVLYLLWLSIS